MHHVENVFLRTLVAAFGTGACVFAVMLGAAAPALAQGRLEARYEATLAGIPVGRGGLTVDIADDQFKVSADGGTSGLVSVFSTGHGTMNSEGRIVKGALSPLSFERKLTTRGTETIRMSLAGGNIRDFSIEPEPSRDDSDVPVTDAHRRGVLDPMTAVLIRAGGNGEMIGPDGCKSGPPVFDGRMRFEVRLAYKRIDAVSIKGYRGPVVVCSAQFIPVAGYNPERPAMKYLAKLRDAEIWFAPLAGTRLLTGVKVIIPTPLGHAVLTATQFVSTAAVTRAQ